jgi:hypothetical protein
MATLPVLDMLLVSWPLKVGLLNWRFGTFGQLSATAATPLIAIFLLYAVAYANGDRKVLYFGIAISLFYALLLLAGLISFPLDSLQMRRRVDAAALQRLTMASGAAELRLIIYEIGALALAFSQIRSVRMLTATLPPSSDPTSSLVMKNLGPARPTPAAGSASFSAPGSGASSAPPTE